MANREKILTVDDLIIEYMISKVENGYEPRYSTEEFMNFLSYFESKMKVADVLYDKDALFKRFFERKKESDWSFSVNDKKIYQPRIDIDEQGVIKANYKLSCLDESEFNFFFIRDITKIKSIILEFLKDQPLRKIIIPTDLNEEELQVGKYIASLMVNNLWRNYIEKYMEIYYWPRQCIDINKYLLETDLAEIITIPSIKKELLEMYDILSKRGATLYRDDKELQIKNYGWNILANSNYNCLVKDYESLIKSVGNKYKEFFNFDLKDESLIRRYNPEVKKLIKTLEDYKK